MKYQILYDWILTKCKLKKPLRIPHFNYTSLNIYQAIRVWRDTIKMETHRIISHSTCTAGSNREGQKGREGVPSLHWMQEPLNLTPNFLHWLIFDCVVPRCMHLSFRDLIICLFISGKLSFLFLKGADSLTNCSTFWDHQKKHHIQVESIMVIL